MSKEIYISSTPHETRLAIVENDALTEMYYERENEYTLAGSIYNGRVTRVLPGMQSSFVDIGLERDAFLYITDFMEEAGDSADFEASDAKNGGRRDRPARRDAEPSSEPTEQIGELAVKTENPRSESSRGEGGRAEGSRNEGRDRSGRRDRNRGSRDARPNGGEARGPDSRSQESRSQESRPIYADEPRAEAHQSVDPEVISAAPSDADAGDIGEGAPGADGSRRWRGRRGRRRGRGDGSETPQAQDAPLQEAAEEVPSREVVLEVSAAAAEPRGKDRGERNNRGGRGGRNDRGDRGGRKERSDGGRENSGREASSARTPQSSSAHEAVEVQPTAEPFILPGESLSKYRRGNDGALEQSATKPTPVNVTFVTATPSTLVDPAAGWDGGLVLPGETLSRHRGGDSSNGKEASPGNNSRRGSDSRGSDSRGSDSRGSQSRNPSRDSGAREERPARRELHPSETVQLGLISQLDPERPETSLPDAAVGSEHVIDFETSSSDVTKTTNEEHVATVHEAVEQTHRLAAEYEPAEDASISFRVDPTPPSEFRQSAPPESPEQPVEPSALAATAPEVPAGHAPETLFAAAEEDAYTKLPAEAETSTEHEFTSLRASGEMLSAPTEPAAEFQAAEQIAAPIAHEAAVQSVTLEEAEAEAAPLFTEMIPSAPPIAQSPAQQFAPGDGELEEEVLDEDEANLPMLHGRSEDDDMEEETLEGTADLGTIIREMSIDQITRPVDSADSEEDDDFDIDEEDLDQDQFESGEEDGEDAVSPEGEEDEYAEGESFEEPAASENSESRAQGQPLPDSDRSAAREGERRPRRDGRNGRRGDRDRGKRDTRGMANSRPTGGGSGGGGRSRQSMQTTNLPDISDLLKPGQELLVQIAKEPIAKKGARITSHIALPGRFLVFMPTVNHIGVSRKIESDGERRRLKEILLSEKGEATGGFIVRTAAANATEEELRSDLRFLLNLWADIKQRSESSKSPALIYHDLNLIERILRDQVTDNFSAIWVDSEAEYERVLRFLQRFQPQLIRRVKLYTKETPLFEQFGITEEINKALRSKVWLKSGGSIVINQTEALVAIDINTGKFVGKTARLEDTIVKTNLDAIPEIVRQIRLRDLGGIIIIDFIDMDERKNRNKVMAALEEELKSDRAPSKVLQFNDFGLVAITRKRVKQSLERTLSTTCGVCAGTGMVKSPVTVCNDIYIEMKKMQKHLDRGDVMLRVNPEVVKQLKAPGTKWLQEMEEMVGKTILIKSDPSIHPEQFDIH